MEQNWEQAIEFIIGSKTSGNDGHEGYKSDNPSDPGGRTIFGISHKSWPKLVDELWNLPKEEARTKAGSFYHENYWLPAGCDQLWNKLDIAVFDTAVNCGVGEAKRILVSFDPDVDYRDYLFERIHYYCTLKRLSIFLAGWDDRVVDLWRLLRKL